MNPEQQSEINAVAARGADALLRAQGSYPVALQILAMEARAAEKERDHLVEMLQDPSKRFPEDLPR